MIDELTEAKAESQIFVLRIGVHEVEMNRARK
jgi:hypothetical protein